MAIEIPQELAQAVRSNDAIAFVGSGLSKPAGGPSWKDLLLRVASTADRFVSAADRRKLRAATKAIKHGRLINAATIIRHIPGVDIQTAIADEIRGRIWNPDGMSSQGNLLRLNLRGIITTNYDRLLEMKMQAMGVKAPDIASYSHGCFLQAIQPGRRFILHLHGDVDHANDIVAAWGDYDALLSSKVIGYIAGQVSIFTTLWLGYSHSDPDVMLALAQGCFGPPRRAFQVVEKSDHELAAMCYARNITPLYADSYEDVPPFLEKLAAMTGAPADIAFLAGIAPLGRGDAEMANVVGGIITTHFLASPLQRLCGISHKLANPRIVNKGREFEFRPEDFLSHWTEASPGEGANRIAIIATPGVGKTVLLSRFAQWLRDDAKELTTQFGGLRPVVVYLSSESLLDAVTSEKTLWHQIEQIVANSTAHYVKDARQDFLIPWCQKHAIYVLFDGVDEFGVRRKGELDELLANLSSVATEHHLNVVLTCRTVFWSQQVQKRQRDLWDEYEIQPFTAGEIADSVGPRGLGQFAYDSQGRVKPGINNRLIVSFVLELKEGGEHPESFKSRFELYEKWVAFTTAKTKKFAAGVLPEQWRGLFKDTAYSLLERMIDSIPLPRLQDGRPAPFDECLATGVLTASSNPGEVRLYHESLNDFFVSSVLVGDFQRVLEIPHDPEALNLLPLAHVDLDFLQPSVYGFLHETLGNDYLTAVRRNVSGADLTQWNQKLLRNLVEYVGMTYLGGPDYEVVVEWLLGLMRSGLDSVIRYNAARALERIHPWAPKPYYDYMSDWGDRDWTQEHNRARIDKLSPWAIRGYRIRGGERVGRKPGKFPYLAVCAGTPRDRSLEARVSAELGGMLGQLLEQLPNEPPRGDAPSRLRPIDCLLINYSYAWTRWFHREHRVLLEDLRRLAANRDDIDETRENLNQWVDNEKLR